MGLNNQLDLELIGEGKPIFTHPSDKKNWEWLDLHGCVGMEFH